jgi:AcrR family transcriptional regulator
MATSTRDRIIEACSAMFMQRGYAASGLQHIVAESEATVGSLYHFFPGGKAELAAETLRVSGAGYQALVESVFDSAPDLISGVRDCFAGAAATLRATDYADACPIATVALEVASSDENLRQVTAEIFESWLRSAASRLEAGGVPSDRTTQLATLLVAALEGGFLLSRAAKDAAPMEAIGDLLVAMMEAEVSHNRTRKPAVQGSVKR